MSRENVELVNGAYDAFLRGDIDAVLALASRDIEVSQPPDMADGATYRGHEGLLHVMAAWIGEWDDYRLEVLRTVDVGDHVLVTVRQHGRGKTSGLEIESVYTWVHTVDGGKVTSWRMFTSEADALEAVGLRE